MSVSPHELHRIAFPDLSAAQLDALRPFGHERVTAAGDVLFQTGEQRYPLVVVLTGRTQILDRSDTVVDVIEDSGPGEIHGELAILIGQHASADCVVSEPGRVLLVPPENLREAIRTSAELSALLISAVVARRHVLVHMSAASITLIGTKPSATVYALKEFLDRSRIPHRFLPRSDPAAAAVLAPLGSPPPSATLAVVRGRRRHRRSSRNLIAD